MKFKELLKRVKKARTANVPVDACNETSNMKLPWNIYESETLGEDTTKFRKIHLKFKYRFLVPLLWISRWILGKWLVKEVPKKEYNENIKLFDDAIEKTIHDWTHIFIMSTHKSNGTCTEERVKKFLNGYNVELIRTMKQLVTTVALDDTAYREFLNMFMFNVTQLMTNHYPKGRTNHLLYNSLGTFDVNYLNLYNPVKNLDLKNTKIEKEADINVKEKSKQPKSKTKSSTSSKKR